MTDNDTTKRAALQLLSQGIATRAEIAGLCGESRQLVRYWARELPDSRGQYLKVQWRAALQAAKQKD